MNKQSASRQAGISYLRIIATIAVVFLHTCSTIEQNSDLFLQTPSQHHFFVLGHTLCLWAVPVFLMMTSSLLMRPGKELTFSDAVRKYCSRIIIALLVFGIPFAGLIQYASGARGTALITGTLLAIVTGDSFAHLWYLYLLIGFYLCLPILKRFVENATPVEIKQTTIAVFVLAFCTSMLSRIAGLKIAFFIPVGYSLFYALASYYLSYIKPIQKKKWMIFLTVGLFILDGIVVYADILPNGLEYYDSPLVAAQAVLLFSFFIAVKEEAKAKTWFWDRLCFGVYLTHPLYIHIAYRLLHFSPLSFGSFYVVGTVVCAVIFTAVSFVGSYVLSKIKPVRKYIL